MNNGKWWWSSSLLSGCLLVTSSCLADVFTVGAGGTHPTLTRALAAAAEVDRSNEIRIAQGEFEGSSDGLGSGHVFNFSNSLTISGGWNATFTEQLPDPTSTSISGHYAHRALASLTVMRGDLNLSNLTVAQGYECNDAGGAVINAAGTSSVTLQQLRFAFNEVDATNWDLGCLTRAQAGGLYVSASNDSKVKVINVEFTGNMALGPVISSALMVSAGDRAIVDIKDLAATNNTAYNSQHYAGPAVYIGLVNYAIAYFSGGRFDQNSSSAMNVGMDDVYYSGGGNSNFSLTAMGASQALIDGLDVRGGTSEGVFRHPLSGIEPTRSSVLLRAYDGGRIHFSDSLVAGSNGIGVRARAYGSASQINLINLTIADNAATGLVAWAPTPVIALSNSIITGNGHGMVSYWPTDVGTRDFPGWLQQEVHFQNLNNESEFNLIGADRRALFIAPDSNPGNYRIRGGSLAHNHGNNTPFGRLALGSNDLAGYERIGESVVDIGAYEFTPFGFFQPPWYFPVDPPVEKPDPVKPVLPVDPGKPGGG